MDEWINRIKVIWEQLREQVTQAIAAAEPGQTALAVAEAVLPVACGILRIVALVFALLILARCIKSLVREKTGRELWGWLTAEGGASYDLLHWENTLGRGRWADVAVDVPTVSRSHAALLRDDRGNWRLQPLQTKNGTMVNGRPIRRTVPIHSGDRIVLGDFPLLFHAVSEEEELEQARRWGVAERPLSPGKTLWYLTIFQIMMAVQCLPGRERPQVVMILTAFGILIAAMWVMYGLYRSLKRTAFEMETLAFFLCTLSFSVSAAYSPEGLLRQTICMLAGLVLFIGLSVLLRDIRATLSLRWPVALATCALLAFNVVLGQKIFGARNWIDLGFVSFQPSEFVKIAFIFTGAATLDRLFARRNLIFTVLFCGFCMGCLALMSDFGTALIFFVALLVIAFLRSGDIGFLALMGTAAAAGCWMILRFKPYIANRFAAWGHVWEFSTEAGGYQQTRTMSAIASGGLFGKGTEDAFLKNIGAANTDLVFGVISEEFGLILALCTVAVLLILTLFSIRCAANGRSSYYVIAANAAGAMLIFQAALNILGSVDILPLTGVTLPFVSIGGSSMISCWGLLAFMKAADTRPNASFTLKLPDGLRGWKPRDRDSMYDEDWYEEDAYEEYEEDEAAEEPYGEEYDDEEEYDDQLDEKLRRYEDDYLRDEPPESVKEFTRTWDRPAERQPTIRYRDKDRRDRS